MRDDEIGSTDPELGDPEDAELVFGYSDFDDPRYDDEPLPRRRTGRRIVGLLVLAAMLGTIASSSGFWLRRSSGPDAPGTRTTLGPVTGPLSTAPVDPGVELGGPPEGRVLTDDDWSVQVRSSLLLGVLAPSCGASLTALRGTTVVTSARHCIEELLDSPDALTGDGPHDVTDRLRQRVRLFDPVSHLPVGVLDRVVVGGGTTDLLVATTTDEHDSLRARQARRLDVAPEVGDEVATFASSAARGFEPYRLTGTYLGRYAFRDRAGRSFTVDLIGYRDPVSGDRIGRGHSGHSSTGAGQGSFGPVLFSITHATDPAVRDAFVPNMERETGIDFEAAGIVAIDEALVVGPETWDAFADLLGR